MALTLRAVFGFTTAEIARAFVASEDAVAQRIVRAKRKIASAGIPYRMPGPEELPGRLPEVLAVLYLLFNEGHLTTSGSGWRRDLSQDALWLTSLLCRLLPEEPEALGLLALMRLHLARADARFADGVHGPSSVRGSVPAVPGVQPLRSAGRGSPVPESPDGASPAGAMPTCTAS